MQIIDKSIDELIPYCNNSRTHDESQILQIASSIKEFGFTNPVLIDEDNGIIAGHGRVLAARKLGINKVPSIKLSHLTDIQKKAYIIADNKIALNAGWDEELLKNEVEQLIADDFDIELTGFSEKELGDLLLDCELLTDGLTNEDNVPEVQNQIVTKHGDIWILGGHRVMCGDSTSITDIENLMAGERADMVFTDPPYGMSYGGCRAAGDNVLNKKGGVKIKAHGMIMNDDLKGNELFALIKDAVLNVKACSKEKASFYICFTWRTYTEFLEALLYSGLKINSCIVWDKKSIGLGTCNYRPQHEFIFYVSGGGEWYGDKSESDVWYMSRGATAQYVHPTQKPVELIERSLLNSSKKGDVIIDVFGGSGSTIIACEKTKRRARLMELDPKYCDVIIKRWQNFTGEEAILESSKTTFDSYIT